MVKRHGVDERSVGVVLVLFVEEMRGKEERKAKGKSDRNRGI